MDLEKSLHFVTPLTLTSLQLVSDFRLSNLIGVQKIMFLSVNLLLGMVAKKSRPPASAFFLKFG